jgi:hypothetical protein
LVEKPPRDRPSACSPAVRRGPARPGRVRVGADDSAVEQVRFPPGVRRRPQRVGKNRLQRVAADLLPGASEFIREGVGSASEGASSAIDSTCTC